MDEDGEDGCDGDEAAYEQEVGKDGSDDVEESEVVEEPPLPASGQREARGRRVLGAAGRLATLQRHVGDGSSALTVDRDLRRPGWQSDDAAAPAVVRPSDAEQDLGMRWLRDHDEMRARECLEAEMAAGCGLRRLAVLRYQVQAAELIDLSGQVASLVADRRQGLKARLTKARRR